MSILNNFILSTISKLTKSKYINHFNICTVFNITLNKQNKQKIKIFKYTALVSGTLIILGEEDLGTRIISGEVDSGTSDSGPFSGFSCTGSDYCSS